MISGIMMRDAVLDARRERTLRHNRGRRRADGSSRTWIAGKTGVAGFRCAVRSFLACLICFLVLRSFARL